MMHIPTMRYLLVAALTLGACREAVAPPATPPVFAPDTTVDATPRVMTLPTADGTGLANHPDYLRMPADWGGHARFLSVTTYPQADPTREWPSIFVQDSVSSVWHLASGTPNPVLEPPTADTYTDPDIIYEPDSGEVWMYVRLVNPVWNILQLIKSHDGRQWTTVADIDSARNHGMISPAVVRRAAGDWYLWSVSVGAAGCDIAGTAVATRRTSTNGVQWSTADTIAIPGHPWHIDVQWVPERNEWWMLYVEGCLPTSVRLATSPDGLTWNPFPTPVIAVGVIPEFKDLVYRSTFTVENDSVRFWFSGAHWDYASDSGWVWRVAASQESATALLTRLAQPAPTATATAVRTPQRVVWPEAP